MDVVILFVMVVGLMLIGVPIAVSLGLSSIIFMVVLSDTSLASIAQQLFNAFAGHYTLLAIPFFILASTFMSTGGVAQRIIRFAIACVGHVRGGLAIASVFACMLFAALSGSSPATVVAIGSICIAGMRQVGYTKDFAAGVICNAGTLGILIPPSIVMVVYAASVDVSVGRMFLAGVIPGIMAGLMLMIGIYIAARVRNLPREEFAGWREIFASARDAAWGLFLIVIILGGIYGGVFTPTEAAAFACVYAMVVEVLIYRKLGVRDLFRISTESAGTIAIILILLAAGTVLTYFLTLSQIPQQVTAMLSGASSVTILLIINAVFLFAGMFADPNSLIIVLTPLIYQAAMASGIDAIHLGAVIVANVALGMVTPPFGLNLFVGITTFRVSYLEVVRAVLPFIVLMLGVLALVTYIPAIALLLPNLMS